MSPKLILIYIGLYENLQRVGNVTYELKLPEDLAYVHRVFHVSMLKKCLGDPASSLLVEGLVVNEKLSMKRFNLK